MKIVSFCSYPSAWPLVFAEASIASALQKRGHDVLFITPGSAFERRLGLMNERIVRSGFRLKGYEIDKVLTDHDRQEAETFIKNSTKETLGELVFDSIPIGRLALYEFLVQHKKMDAELTQKEWVACQPHVKNTLISYFACHSILTREKPDAVLMYNTLYSTNQVWERYAKQKDVAVYFLHHGANLSDREDTLIIGKNDTFYHLQELKKIWATVREVPAPADMLHAVTDHFLALLKGTHYFAYSAPKSKKSVSPRNLLGIKAGQRVLVATMGSYDEQFAARYTGAWEIPKEPLFSSQAEWIRALVNYVKDRPDLCLVIRVHPREFPNKRELVKSEHAMMLENIFKELPENVKVNWPTDNLSIYDLAQETDVFLNSWSSAGAEMSILGIPVVLYAPELPPYPSDLNYSARDRNDYFENIELALKKGWDYEKIRHAYRWFVLYYGRTTMRFRDKSKTSDMTSSATIRTNIHSLYRQLPVWLRNFVLNVRLRRERKRECVAQNARYIDTSTLEKMLHARADTLVDMDEITKSQPTAAAEEASIKSELRRIYEALYGTQTDTAIRAGTLQDNLKKAISSVP